MTTPEDRKRYAWRRLIQGFASMGIAVAIFAGVLPQIAGYRDVWSRVVEVSGFGLSALVVVTAANLFAGWWLLMAVLPGLTLPQAAAVNLASTAVANTVPGGGAIGVGVSYAMYRSWGFTPAAVALTTLVSGIWNGLAKFGLPVLALALVALEGGITGARLITAAVGVATLAATIGGFAWILSAERMARRVGSTMGRWASALRRRLGRTDVGDWGEVAVRFRSATIDLLRDRWVMITAAAIASHLSLFAVLLVALRALDVGAGNLSWIEALAAFAFVRLISALPVTPGAVGVVELGLTAALGVAATATTDAQLVAAVLLFRALTYLVPVPLGLASYLWWRAASRSRPTEVAR